MLLESFSTQVRLRGPALDAVLTALGLTLEMPCFTEKARTNAFIITKPSDVFIYVFIFVIHLFLSHFYNLPFRI